MKTLITTAVVMLCFSAFSQITLEGTWVNGSDRTLSYPINLTNGGLKFVVQNDTSIEIHNDNGSILKSIPFKYTDGKLITNSFNSSGIPYFSDQLFDQDNQIEFLIKREIPGSYDNVLQVINELNQVEFTFPDTLQYGEASASIAKNGSKFQLVIQTLVPEGSDELYKTIVYNLPGSLPCEVCGLNGFLEQSAEPSGAEIKAYPNPFSNNLRVEYKLTDRTDGAYLLLTTLDGREVKRQPVDKNSDNILLQTADLPKGIIMASIYDGRGNLVTKKVVKVD